MTESVKPGTQVVRITGTTGDEIRGCESEAIWNFVAGQVDLYKDKDVLDYGCGRPGTCRKPEPYRGIVEMAGGRWVGYDKGECFPVNKNDTFTWDVILCTQVVQYLSTPEYLIDCVKGLRRGGHVVMTYSHAWPSSEVSDRWRYTQVGIVDLLVSLGLEPVTHEELCVLDVPGFRLPLTSGVVGRKKG